MDAAVVELDALADTVGAAAEDHDLVTAGGFGLALLLVGGIHVGGVGGEFGGAGIDPLVDRTDPQTVPVLAHFPFADAEQPGQAAVGEALALEHEQALPVEIGQCAGAHAFLQIHDLLDLHQKPGVDVGQTVQIVHVQPHAEGIGNVPQAHRPRALEFLLEPVHGIVGLAV